MDINIFGYKFRLEVLIIIVLLWWILCGHTICSCSNVTLPQAYEAFQNLTQANIRQFATVSGKNPTVGKPIINHPNNMKRK
jgi:hypothetical protein